MTEFFSVKFTNAALADGESCGVKESGTLGETVAFGEPVYFKTADSKWWLAKAT